MLLASEGHLMPKTPTNPKHFKLDACPPDNLFKPRSPLIPMNEGLRVEQLKSVTPKPTP